MSQGEFKLNLLKLIDFGYGTDHIIEEIELFLEKDIIITGGFYGDLVIWRVN